MRGSRDFIWGREGWGINAPQPFEALVVLFDHKMVPKMFQQKNKQQVVCNLVSILASNFSLLLLPTGSPLTKLRQFWPLLPPPKHTICCMTAKSSLQPSIYRKSKKDWQLFPRIFVGKLLIYGGSLSAL